MDKGVGFKSDISTAKNDSAGREKAAKTTIRTRQLDRRCGSEILLSLAF